MSTVISSALIDSANGDNNSSEIEIEEGEGVLLNEDQYGELIQLQNVQLPVEHDISSRNGIVILPYDTTSATPLPVQL